MYRGGQPGQREAGWEKGGNNPGTLYCTSRHLCVILFNADDPAPLWKACFLPCVNEEIEALEGKISCSVREKMSNMTMYA